LAGKYENNTTVTLPHIGNLFAAEKADKKRGKNITD
jgi:hypothetical protein